MSGFVNCGFCGERFVANTVIKPAEFFVGDDVSSVNCPKCGNLVWGMCWSFRSSLQKALGKSTIKKVE